MRWQSSLALISVVVLGLTGCGSGFHINPVQPGIKVGLKAPLTRNLVVGKNRASNGKIVTLKWDQTSTAQSPAAVPIQSETIRHAILHHQPTLVIFDVPAHETLGDRDMYYGDHILKKFKKQHLAVIMVDAWKDLPAAHQWGMSAAVHHGFYLVGPHGYIRYGWIGLFDYGQILNMTTALLQHHYHLLWSESPQAMRLPWNKIPK